MKSRAFLVIILMLFAARPGRAGDGDYLLVLHLIPSIDFPLGESRDVLAPAGAVSVLAEYRLGLGAPLSLAGGIGYSYHPVLSDSGARRGVSVFSALAGLGVAFPLGPQAGCSLHGFGGYYFSLLSEVGLRGTGSSPLLAARGSLWVRPVPRFGFSAGASYKIYFSRLELADGDLQAEALFSGFNTFLGVSYFFLRGGNPL